MTFILDSLLNSDVVFYSVFTVIAGGLSYSFASSYFNPQVEKVDKNVQTDS